MDLLSSAYFRLLTPEGEGRYGALCILSNKGVGSPHCLLYVYSAILIGIERDTERRSSHWYLSHKCTCLPYLPEKNHPMEHVRGGGGGGGGGGEAEGFACIKSRKL